jgi:hypothetical protein
MVPAYADEPNVHIVIEQQENKDTVDSAAAWAHAIVRATTVYGSIGVGGLLSIASGYPAALFGGILCSCLWDGILECSYSCYGMNSKTKATARSIYNSLGDGVWGTAIVVGLCTLLHRHMVANAIPKTSIK